MSEFVQCYLITCVTLVSIITLVKKELIDIYFKKKKDKDLEMSINLDNDENLNKVIKGNHLED